MARLPIPTPEAAPAASKPVLDAVQQQMGFVPNVVRVLSNSPIALQAFMGLQGALMNSLDVGTRNAVALSVSQANDSGYCKRAHSFVANAMANTAPAEIALNLQGKSSDPKVAAAATFGQRLIETRGKVDDADLKAIRAAGFADAQIVEIIAFTAQVLMTNFINNVADTEIDIPALQENAA